MSDWSDFPLVLKTFAQFQQFIESSPNKLLCLTFIHDNKILPPIHMLMSAFLRDHANCDGRILRFDDFPAEVASQQITLDPTSIIRLKGRVLKRFSGMSFKDVTEFMAANEPREAFVGSGHTLGGAGASVTPRAASEKIFFQQLEQQRKRRVDQKPNSKPPPPPPPPRDPSPPPAAAEPDSDPGFSMDELKQNLRDMGFADELIAEALGKGGWEFNECCEYINARMSKQPLPPFSARPGAEELPLMPEQQLLVETFTGTFLREELVFGCIATKSADEQAVFDWIERYQNGDEKKPEIPKAQAKPTVSDNALWAEVDWILAGRPYDKAPICRAVKAPSGSEQTKAVSSFSKAENERLRRRIELEQRIKTHQALNSSVQKQGARPSGAAQNQAPSRPFCIQFKLPTAPPRSVTFEFPPDAKIADMVAKLRQKHGDIIGPAANVQFENPPLPGQRAMKWESTRHDHIQIPISDLNMGTRFALTVKLGD
jgi:hypothetical protein